MIKQKKVRKDKGKKHNSKGMHKKTYEGMLNLKDIFHNRTKVILGLRKDEIISLYYNISQDKLLKMNIKSKWDSIRAIKKYLLWKDNFAIISKAMPRGTTLYDNILGNRILEKTEHVYFKCSDIENAGKWRDTLDKIAKGIFKTSSRPSEIIEAEEIQLPIAQRLKGV